MFPTVSVNLAALLITHQAKICVPHMLQKPLVKWYQVHLCHPGVTRMDIIVLQHFIWEGLTTKVKKYAPLVTGVKSQNARKKMVMYLPKKQM